MKKITLLMVLLPLFCFSQTQVFKSIYGIPFSSSRENVIHQIALRGGYIDVAKSTKTKLVVCDLSFGMRPTEKMVFSFENNQMYQATAVFKPENASILDLFNAVKSDIESIYGNGKMKKEFLLPYKEGDGTEMIAIRRGFANYNCSWSSQLQNQHKAVIDLTTNKNELQLVYEDLTVIENFLAERRRSVKYRPKKIIY